MIKKELTIPKDVLIHILKQNDERLQALFKRYNPVTSEGLFGKRVKFVLSDYIDGAPSYIPFQMLENEPFVVALMNCGSFDKYVEKYMSDFDTKISRETVVRRFLRLRCKYDFFFYAYCYGKIKNKDGGPDIPFYLRPAQRKLIKAFENKRIANEPIRVILLKCRQWGGSTATDVYMAWLQIFWKINWNSNIVGHQSTSATNVFSMYEKLINATPLWLFHDIGEEYPSDEKKLISVGMTQNIKRMVPRQCNIQTGSARNPESARSGDAAMAHITEEAFFPDTIEWTPAKVVNSAISAIMPKAFTFIVRESTPNGRENEFHEEWARTKQINPNTGKPLSAYVGVFVAWYEIEEYITKMTQNEKINFADELYKNRFDEKFNGKYYWWLFQKGATLEGIKWYITKSTEYANIDDMKQEFPSDDIEAFKYSGSTVFDDYKITEMEKDCLTPTFIGEIEGDSLSPEDKGCMSNIRLTPIKGGCLYIWDYPDDSEKVLNRYLVAVDIGGAHKTSDYHDIVVLDRYDLMYGGVPCIVAEWHGHCDPDQLAMKCAQISYFYCSAYLVVENNTAYSKMNKTDGDVSQLFFPILLNIYDNIYSNNQSKLLKHHQKEKKWGFNTNKSNKESLINNYRRVIREHQYIERETEALIECGYYMLYPTGEYGAAPGYHDDRVMARSIGLFVSMFDMDAPKIIREKTIEEKMFEKMRKKVEHEPIETAGI
jgi:hypothetical protein